MDVACAKFSCGVLQIVLGMKSVVEWLLSHWSKPSKLEDRSGGYYFSQLFISLKRNVTFRDESQHYT